ncbi:hypothetical protein [Arthrobacter sp. SAFR-044]|uniref:hypothetical protein n=1 Tax=Arthrobacter sp. SAFR-044 TaxID=3387278 RepID=UPI003F7B5958
MTLSTPFDNRQLDFPHKLIRLLRLTFDAETLKYMFGRTAVNIETWQLRDDSLCDATFKGATLATPFYQETLVSGDGLRWILPNPEEGASFPDPKTKATFELGPASTDFLIATVTEISDTSEAERNPLLRGQRMARMRLHQQSKGSIDIYELIRTQLGNPLTVKVITEVRQSETRLQSLIESFVFHLSVNTEIPIVPQVDISPLTEPKRTSRSQRLDIEEMEPPRLIYESELVYHFQLGLSADSPVLAYLSFYHILEHWFENVYFDDAIDKAREMIVHPTFSLKRDSDMKRLIKAMTLHRRRSEEVGISEEEALVLTLRKFVDLERLRATLSSNNPEVLNHICTSVVGFADGKPIDFEHRDVGAPFKQIASRIYKTRNALVHSKDSTYKTFRPFRDDATLVPEVHLLRAVAEQVVVATAKER